jgi:probable O-glycosylation ligase (exosortase A-associated)
VILVAGISMLAFMPEHWTERMSTIRTYSDDLSALGRFSAWWVSWRVAFDYPTGVGFFISRPELFAQYSPYPELGTPVAHSIYFQVLGHHGFFGLFLFLMIWLSTWVVAGRMRKQATSAPQARWCADLGAMAQVSMVGYLAGGAFLSLSYFDLPYYLMALVCCAYAWMRSRRWETEPRVQRRWSIPGLFGVPSSTETAR